MECSIDDIFYVLYTQVHDINTGGLSIPMLLLLLLLLTLYSDQH